MGTDVEANQTMQTE